MALDLDIKDTTDSAGTAIQRHRCGSCGRLVSMLVDDGPLCIRCDSLFFPAP